MRVEEIGCQKVSFVLGAGVLVIMGIPGVMKTSQLSKVSFPFASFVGILYLI
jgi:ABC-type phosphonate transport system ATPase subunit